MTEDELEKAALASAANMGPAEHAWVPGVGKIVHNYDLTPAGVEYLRPFMAACISCEMPVSKDFHCFNCFPTQEIDGLGSEPSLFGSLLNWIKGL